ncbi:MAG: methionine biosynthesis protein MetW, partial [Rhodospirillaceae bacterium]|nr:methionine biosynthesis protein MetW [Rhodospirillaceae bacterium]
MNDDAADRKSIRIDLQLIADMIEANTRVLDAGCGNGTLLDYLWHFKQVDGRGIEISTDGVKACVSTGLSVIQGDVETDLKDYPDKSFDYVVLSQTLQAMRDPKEVLHQLTRIGKRAIVSFPNFGYWRYRLYILLKGRMPVSESIPYQWYDTPNIHFCTIRDFQMLAEEM